MMELEVNANCISEAIFEVEDDIDATAAFENEKCGICMDLIIDRGVLDCCDHWFCFACIDNWATITNLCPLCKNEFQLITCIPVYDTIGSFKAEEDSLSRDDDWCIEGNNNTLSFPSYYIDENAVICLDGDGCKIRSGKASTEEDAPLDTSIACDSCDIWYHAFCVGFDPDGTSENSWLCPRCIIDGLPQKSDGVSTQRMIKLSDQENADPDRECPIEDAFFGKVLVSVADTGETAVVVSMVEGKQVTETSEKILPEIGRVEINLDKEFGRSLSNLSANNTIHSPENEDDSKISCNRSSPETINRPYVDSLETSLVLSLSRDTSSVSPFDKLALSELKNNSSSRMQKPSGTTYLNSVPAESESGIDLHLGLSVRSSLPGGNPVAVDTDQKNLLEGSSISIKKTDKIVNETDENVAGFMCEKNFDVSGEKRKHMEKSRNNEESESSDKEVKIETESPVKKARSDGKSPTIPSKCHVSPSIPHGSQGSSTPTAISTDDKSTHIRESEVISSDIMSIVQGTDRRSSKAPAQPSSTNKLEKEKDHASGLRVKKIMRRVTEDKESSTLIQKLRKEIRDAVRDNASKDSSKNDPVDLKLLTAFRAAIVGPKIEPIKKVNPLVVRSKRSILQKGKTRENLTKKIYGTASGRRRRAWDREWEIEFWKHRCARNKPEKVETLKSVLDLLLSSDFSSKSLEMEQRNKLEAPDPILSRLYLADASVFPRTQDIKPLSALNKEQDLSAPVQNNMVKVDNTGKKGNVASVKGDAANRKAHPNGLKTGAPTSVSMPSGPKANTQNTKETSARPDDVKIDKRKWALEVLARKNAVIAKDATQGKQEDKTALKGNYPLLAQLPIDMRPVLASGRHNKVPTSVRQAQLYRLTEQLLRKANLPVIRRTADTELAVADAVNIEKEIFDRSNSKLVYVNLCSQVVSQHTNKSKPRIAEPISSQSEAAPAEGSEQAAKEATHDSGELKRGDVEEALKMAGLLSDSPPNSPNRATELDGEDVASTKIREEGPENVFDIDSHPELDIYGDFEYDLEDEDYIGHSRTITALKVPSLQPEDGNPKLKVILSTTVNCEKSDGDTEDLDSENTEAPINPPSLIDCHQEKGPEIEIENNPGLLRESVQSERDEELSLAECEELYGPDREPLVKKISDNLVGEPHNPLGNEATAETMISGEKRNRRSNESNMVAKFEGESCEANNFVVEHDSSGGENSPNHSLMSESGPRKETRSDKNDQSDFNCSVFQKVEAYIKEHIRPLCKSGVITADQYRWAVTKTTEKVMKYHFRAKNANFLIKEGEKVKKLAKQYVKASQQKKER